MNIHTQHLKEVVMNEMMSFIESDILDHFEDLDFQDISGRIFHIYYTHYLNNTGTSRARAYRCERAGIDPKKELETYKKALINIKVKQQVDRYITA